MTEQQAMRMALEALELVLDVAEKPKNEINEAITALRQALEQQQYEPVAWNVWVEETQKMTIALRHGVQFLLMAEENAIRIGNAIKNTRPQPAAWVGLTQQDIDIAFDDTQEGGGFDEFARAIEAALRSKNT